MHRRDWGGGLKKINCRHTLMSEVHVVFMAIIDIETKYVVLYFACNGNNSPATPYVLQNLTKVPENLQAFTVLMNFLYGSDCTILHLNFKRNYLGNLTPAGQDSLPSSLGASTGPSPVVYSHGRP